MAQPWLWEDTKGLEETALDPDLLCWLQPHGWEELDMVELHPRKPDLGQEGPSRASRTFHPVGGWVAFPKDMVGVAVQGPVLLRADLLGSHVGLGTRWENSQEKGLEGLSSAFRRAPEMPPVPGAGGSLCFCLLWITARLGTQYSDLGWVVPGAAGAGGGGVVVVLGGLWEAPAAQRARGGFAELCVVSPCPPGVTQPGIRSLGRGFGHRHRWELPLLHPRGNEILRRDRHWDSTPGAPAGQGVPLQSPPPALLSAILFFEVI